MREAVLSAVAELILTEGAGAVTALRVSQRAGVARSTIYDHWPTSEALVLDAIDMVIAPQAPITTTADLGADLLSALAACAADWKGDRSGSGSPRCSTTATESQPSLRRRSVLCRASCAQ